MSLTDTIRGRMIHRSTADLLQVWVENDRQLWSPATFDAVRSILTERGVTIPPQNQPPVDAADNTETGPVAEAQAPWRQCARAMAILGIVLAIGEIGARACEGFGPSRLRSGTLREIAPVLFNCALPILLLVAASGCLKLRPWARTVMIVYAWLTLAWQMVLIADASWNAMSMSQFDVGWWGRQVSLQLRRAVFPLVAIYLLTRPPVKRLFASAVIGFAVVVKSDANTSEASARL